MTSYVYMLTNKKNGTLYTGVTSDVVRRVFEHKQKMVDGFTQKYGVDKLVYFEIFDDIREAISREKAIKKWNRAWKIEKIVGVNPEWRDLYEEICA